MAAHRTGGRLLGWLAIVAALSVVLVGGYLVLTNRLGPASRASPSEEAAGMNPQNAPLALWDAFELAQAAVHAQATDAVLVSASTQWQEPSQDKLVAGTPDWSFVFYAPSVKSSLDVGASAGIASVLKVTPAWVAPRTLEEGPWRAGPQDALLVFLAYEGSDFLVRNPQAVVDLNLARNDAGQAVWTITALDAEAGQFFALVIDASSSKVLRREKPEFRP
jgi:hypothetical protein